MKTIQTVLFGLSLIVLAGGSSAAQAADATKLPEAVIAVVKIEHILQVSEPSKYVEEEVKKLRKEKIDDLNAREKNLQEEKAKLDKQKAIISPDAYQKKLQGLNTERQKLQQEYQIFNASLNRALAGIRADLKKRIVHFSAQVSHDRGVNIGMDEAKIIFFDKKMDITDEVLALLNKENPKYDLTLNTPPEGEGDKKGAEKKQ